MHEEAVARDSMSPIDAELERLRDAIDQTDRDTSRLIERIRPILAPENPRPESDAIAAVFDGSDVAVTIHQLGSRLLSLTIAVREILDRVQT